MGCTFQSWLDRGIYFSAGAVIATITAPANDPVLGRIRPIGGSLEVLGLPKQLNVHRFYGLQRSTSSHNMRSVPGRLLYQYTQALYHILLAVKRDRTYLVPDLCTQSLTNLLSCSAMHRPKGTTYCTRRLNS